MNGKILVVDDSMTARKLVVDCLVEQGCDVIEAVDGKDGLAKIQENTDINLIFSDINMPWLSGLEMVSEIKKLPNLAQIPICMLTTESGTESVAEAKKLGVDAFLVKPVQKEQLIMVLEGYLKAAG
ncbi:response regulator [Pseudobacteriovorax antillogorgiicola]|uniref:Two-component system, chemotaxis family, response regulator CheY n=1 Tax=Pseudobacteriovorax antillogorgiicola TaxID=1513793 RepID=A0A1Y6B289_9BACT|nr:response regulator [Pseudobacteriovorax antillogorgiicola]TCS59501.1 two-component system chemotaxis response regulator CheY [Pseudobacteriovorax antillogorgiicola]SME87901.1 two-component system, chemotaxis family, response regulator CheY [Pseudobacteriovorax antillogorgiicola]